MMDGEMALTDLSQSYTRTGTKQGILTVRAAEVGHPKDISSVNLEAPQETKFRFHTNKLLLISSCCHERCWKDIISNPNSHFMKKLASQSTIVDKIDFAFKAILQRKATSREKNDFTETLKIIGTNDIHKDIAWILLNSHEFLFVR